MPDPQKVVLIIGLAQHGKSHILQELHRIFPLSSSSSPSPSSNQPSNNFHFQELPALNLTAALPTQLAQLAQELESQNPVQQVIAGIIYVHDIDNGIVLINTPASLQAFKRLLGKDLRNLVLLTNRWDKMEKATGQTIEQNYKTQYWNLYIEAGATVERYLDRTDLTRVVHGIWAKTEAKKITSRLFKTAFSGFGGGSGGGNKGGSHGNGGAGGSANKTLTISGPPKPAPSLDPYVEQQLVLARQKMAEMEKTLDECHKMWEKDKLDKEEMSSQVLNAAAQNMAIEKKLNLAVRQKKDVENNMTRLGQKLEDEKALRISIERTLEGVKKQLERELDHKAKVQADHEDSVRQMRVEKYDVDKRLAYQKDAFIALQREMQSERALFEARVKELEEQQEKVLDERKMAVEELEALRKESMARESGPNDGTKVEVKSMAVQESPVPLPSPILFSTPSFMPATQYFPPPVRHSSGPQLRDIPSSSPLHSPTYVETGSSIRSPQQFPTVHPPQLYPALQNAQQAQSYPVQQTPEGQFYFPPPPPPPAAPQQYPQQEQQQQQQQQYQPLSPQPSLSSSQSLSSPPLGNSNSTIVLDSVAQALQDEIAWIEAQHKADMLQEEQEIARMEMEMQIQQRKQKMERLKAEKMAQLFQARQRVHGSG